MPHRVLLPLWIVVALFTVVAPASAQKLPASIRLVPELALALDQANAVKQPVAPVAKTPATPRTLRRGRALMAAGVGLLVGGTAGLAVGLSGSKCDDDDESRVTVGQVVGGGLVAGLGLTFTLGGLRKVQLTAPAVRQSTEPSGWLPLLGLGTAATSFVMVMMAGIPESMRCWDS